MAARDYHPCCALCGGPGEPECPHEGEKLRLCIDQAEKRWIEGWIGKIREWATNHSVQYITDTFNQRRAARYRNHAAYLQTIPHYIVYAQYRGRPPLHPHILATLQRQIADANSDLCRDIDADWKACVLRYPEVLTHFYSMVRMRIPPDAAPPQLKGLSGPAPAAPPPSQTLGYGMGVLPDPLPVRSAAGSTTGGGGGGGGGAASSSKRSNAGGSKRMSMPAGVGRAQAEREKELEREFGDHLYPRGAERKKGGGGGGGPGSGVGLAGLGVPPPPPPVPEIGAHERDRAARRRRDSTGYMRNPMAGAAGVPMAPTYWGF